MEYGGGHDAGITGGPDQRLEAGKEARSSWPLKQTGVADFGTRSKLNSRSCGFAGAEEGDIIASSRPFSVRPAGVNIQRPIMGWLSLHAPAEYR